MKAAFFLALLAPNAAAFIPPQTSLLSRAVARSKLNPDSLCAFVPGSDRTEGNLFQPFIDIFQRENVSSPDEVVIDPDYKLAWIFAAAAAWIFLFYPDKTCFNAGETAFCPPTAIGAIFAFLHLWFAAFLADRAARIRIIFTKDNFCMKDHLDPRTGNVLSEMKERKMNYVIGGYNKWSYDSIKNWDFFPSVNLSILVYFKETKTPESKWVVGPGKYDPYGGGMVHFFPAFGNAYQIKREFEKRVPKKSSK